MNGKFCSFRNAFNSFAWKNIVKIYLNVGVGSRIGNFGEIKMYEEV